MIPPNEKRRTPHPGAPLSTHQLAAGQDDQATRQRPPVLRLGRRRAIADLSTGSQHSALRSPCLPTVWISRLLISKRVAHKIVTTHGVEGVEVRDAIECVPGLTGSWDYDPERGHRLLIYIEIRDRRVLAVLYPTDDPFREVFRLGSAYPVNK